MSEGVFFFCVTILVVLFYGDPSLLDAIIKHVGECKP